MKQQLIIILLFLGSALGAQSTLQSFYDSHISEGIVDYESIAKQPQAISAQVDYYTDRYLKGDGTDEALIADGINLYNLLVIKKIIDAIPVQSVEQINGFFTNKISERLPMSLNELESKILKLSQDPRIHFALICGGASCPAFPKTVFVAEKLDLQLDQQTKSSLLENKLVQYDSEQNLLQLNQIFKWYSNDFEPEGVLRFINRHSDYQISEDAEVRFLIYDWTLNASETKRYVATNLYEAGEFEIHSFNNYYTQREKGNLSDGSFGRYNFLNHFLNTTIGLNSKLNFGLGFKFRSVNQDRTTTKRLLSALQYRQSDFEFNEDQISISYARTGLTNIYPSVRYSPFKNKPSISITHTAYIPLGSNYEGTDETGFLDWEGVSLQNSLWFDKDLGFNKSLFLDGTLLLENIGNHLWSNNNGYTQIGLGGTAIYNHHTPNNWTYYGLFNLTPRIGINNNGQNKNIRFLPFSQIGGGIKKYISSKLEVELLYTVFYDGTPNRFAQTFNLGFRYIGN